MGFMNKAEVGRVLKCSRSNVNQAEKSGLAKFYKQVLSQKLAESPFEVLQVMVAMFDINDQEDINEFYKCMPKKIKESIIRDVQSKTDMQKLY